MLPGWITEDVGILDGVESEGLFADLPVLGPAVVLGVGKLGVELATGGAFGAAPPTTPSAAGGVP